MPHLKTLLNPKSLFWFVRKRFQERRLRLQPNTADEYEWAKYFKFRFLPQYIRIKNSEAAEKRLTALRATIIIWGVVTQKSREPLEIRLHLKSPVHSYSFSHFTIEKFPMDLLQLFTLVEGAGAMQRRGDDSRARYLFEQARPIAKDLDGDDPSKSKGLLASVDEQYTALRPPPDSK